MLKIKSVRSVIKRFKKTSKGKFKKKKSNLRHILTKKSSKRKRNLKIKSMLCKSDIKLIKYCVPYI